MCRFALVTLFFASATLFAQIQGSASLDLRYQWEDAAWNRQIQGDQLWLSPLLSASLPIRRQRFDLRARGEFPRETDAKRTDIRAAMSLNLGERTRLQLGRQERRSGLGAPISEETGAAQQSAEGHFLRVDTQFGERWRFKGDYDHARRAFEGDFLSDRRDQGSLEIACAITRFLRLGAVGFREDFASATSETRRSSSELVFALEGPRRFDLQLRAGKARLLDEDGTTSDGDILRASLDVRPGSRSFLSLAYGRDVFGSTAVVASFRMEVHHRVSMELRHDQEARSGPGSYFSRAWFRFRSTSLELDMDLNRWLSLSLNARQEASSSLPGSAVVQPFEYDSAGVELSANLGASLSSGLTYQHRARTSSLADDRQNQLNLFMRYQL